jgi:Zn-dependent protease
VLPVSFVIEGILVTGITEKFSIPLSRVFAQVQVEVQQLGQSEILPEHILLSLLAEKSSTAFKVFTSLNVNLAEFEGELRRSLLTREISANGQEISMSEEIKRVLNLSLEAQSVLRRTYLGTEHLLVGMLRDFSGRGYSLLRRAGVSYNQLLDLLKRLPPEQVSDQRMTTPEQVHLDASSVEKLSPFQIFQQISPVFWGMLLLTVLAGMAAYFHWFRSDFAVFLFVTLGWIVSVSLHEFGHALIAYLGGDHGVIQRGYLSLNPLRYTHGFMSIIMPVVILMLGGIGLPGGVVYVNLNAVRGKRMRSLVAAAGPIITGVITLLLAVPFLFGLAPTDISQHSEFWAGLTFLTFIQLWAFIFNLLPIPGFDGFGILMPFLPRKFAIQVSRFGSLILFAFIALYLSDTIVQRVFWRMIGIGLTFLGLDVELVGYGLDLFRFW